MPPQAYKNLDKPVKAGVAPAVLKHARGQLKKEKEEGDNMGETVYAEANEDSASVREGGELDH